MIKQLSLLWSTPCGFQLESPDVRIWAQLLSIKIARDPRVGRFEIYNDNKTRIHCHRNAAAAKALELNCEYLLFVDPDARPDCRVYNDRAPADQQPNARPWVKPFWESSLDFMLSNRAGVVAAPAVSQRPQEAINVFLFREKEPFSRMTHAELETIDPQFLPVAAIGTHLMLIDTEVFRHMKQPWFEDVYEADNKQIEVQQSQDSVFCLKCNELGFPVYANLFAPAGHNKMDCLMPPAWKGSAA